MNALIIVLLIGIIIALTCVIVFLHGKSKSDLANVQTNFNQQLEVERLLRDQLKTSAQQEEAHLKELMQATVSGALERFASVSNEQIKANGSELSLLNRKNISEILDPLKQRIKEYEDSLKSQQEKTAQHEAALKVHAESMAIAAKQIGSDANNFISNLTCSNKFQGNFGENRLAAVLQSIGLTSDTDFKLQEGESNSIPDCKVFDHVSKKIFIIDAKMSWTNYQEACATTDPEKRKELLKKHADSIKNQINNLASKKYHEKLTPDIEGYSFMPFSIMFVPSDGALLTALENEPSLPVDAEKKNIYLTSPLTLFGFLKLVEKGKSCYEFATNLQNMMKDADLIVKRIDDLFSYLENASAAIDKAQQAVQGALNVAATDGSGQSIKGPAERLISRGTKLEKKKSKTLKTTDEDESTENAE